MLGWIEWVGSRRICFLAHVGALGVACGDDTSVVDDGSSGDTPTTGMTSSDELPPDLPPADSSDDGSSDSGSSGDGGDTDGPPGGPEGGVRIYYDVRQPDAVTFVRLDIIDDVVAQPDELFEISPPEYLQLEGDRWMSGQRNGGVTAYDLLASPPQAWPIDLPAGTGSSNVIDRTNDDATWLIASSAAGESALHTVELGDDGPSVPWQVNGEIEADAVYGFVRAGDAVIFREGSVGSPTSFVWQAPAHDLAAPATLVLEAPDLVSAYLDSPGGGMFVLRNSGGTYVDMREEQPAAPQPIALPPGDTQLHWITFEPDGSGVVAVHEVAFDVRELIWIAIEDGVAMPAITISDGATAGVASIALGFSADGRWLALTAGAGNAIHVVDFAGPVPSAPISLLAPGETSFQNVKFSTDSRFIYHYAEMPGGEVRVRRVALDGDVPGEAETLSGPLATLVYLEPADDGSSLLYLGYETDDGPQHAWWVDVSGDAPADPVRIDPDLAPPQYTFNGDLAPASTHALLQIYLDAQNSRRDVVDLSSGATFSLADGASIDFTAMRPHR